MNLVIVTSDYFGLPAAALQEGKKVLPMSRPTWHFDVRVDLAELVLAVAVLLHAMH